MAVSIELLVCSAVANVFGVSKEKVSLDTILDSPLWDSFAAVQLVSRIESRFRVELSADDAIRLTSAVSVQELVLVVERVLASSLKAHNGTDSSRLPSQEHTIRHSQPLCRQLFYLYRGRAKMMTGVPSQFLRQTRIHERNFLLFADPSGRDYACGLDNSIANFRQFLEWQLEQKVTHFPHVDEEYALGTSSGAMAAILSGHYLKYSVVWSFGLTKTELRSKESVYFADGLEAKFRDLRDILASHNGITEYRLFYNEDFYPDRVAAEQLARCPGVILLPQSGEDGHFVLESLLKREELADLLVPYRGIGVTP